MRQYHNLLKEILAYGTDKSPARANMPSSRSLFGYQMRFNLLEGFPLITTKKMNWKAIVAELLWFLRGDTNIKFLVDNGVNIWNEDAYNYYLKVVETDDPYTFEEFIWHIKNKDAYNLPKAADSRIKYTLGDCGHQYGKQWRNFRGVDQIRNVVSQIMTNPEGRRHLVTSIDPGHDTDLALYWCHAMFQFNCRKMTAYERENCYAIREGYNEEERYGMNPNASDEDVHRIMDEKNVPKYFLDCHLYQRSADVFLGVPFNIASYALLNFIIARIANMEVGHFIHSFGDVHIYENHREQVIEQLKRTPKDLPKHILIYGDGWKRAQDTLDFSRMVPEDIHIFEYDSHPAIKAKLSTGLK